MVAATGAVGDAETRELMARFHDLVSAGTAPDEALAKGQSEALQRGHLTAVDFGLFAVL